LNFLEQYTTSLI